MAETYSAGIVTAYGAAVRGGYTGTYEEFCAEQASFAENAKQVGEDRAAMETLAAQFSDTTVPAAVQTVQDAGTAQIQAVESASETEQQQIALAGEAQETRVTQAGDDQVDAVEEAGATQVGNVNTAGTTQVNAVQAKGQEVIDSIPDDYSELSGEVSDLKSAFDDLLEDEVNTPVSATWAQGRVQAGAGGVLSETESTTFANTNFILMSKSATITIASGYKIFAWKCAYNEFGHPGYQVTSAWTESSASYTYDADNPYLIMNVMKANSSTITAVEAAAAVFISCTEESPFALKVNTYTGAVNVRAYGALGEGGNYTTEITNAITDCPTNGVLYFPAGTYVVNNMALKSNMTIVGEGKATIIKLEASQPDGSNCCAVNNVHDVSICNISFDGNRLNEQSGGASYDAGFNGVHIRTAYNVLLDRVYSYNNGYHGCIVTDSHDITIRNGEFHDNGYRPIHGHSNVKNVRVESNACWNNGLGFDEGSGMQESGFDAVFFFDEIENLAICNNHIFDVNTNACIELGGDVLGTGSASSGILVADNILETKGTASGIRLLGRGISSVNIVGNSIDGCQYGIYFYDTASTADGLNRDIVVTGNTIQNATDIGIIFAYAYSHVVISNNTIPGVALIAISINGQHDIIIQGNTITGFKNGINITNAARINIANNIMETTANDTTYGINIAGSAQSDILIQSNTICDYKNGIQVGGTDRVNIANNLIRAVRTGSPADAGILAYNTSSYVYILYNFCSKRIANLSTNGITLPA